MNISKHFLSQTVVIILIAYAVLFVSCKEDEDPIGPSFKTENLIGVWDFVRIVSPVAYEGNCSTSATAANASFYGARFTINDTNNEVRLFHFSICNNTSVGQYTVKITDDNLELYQQGTEPFWAFTIKDLTATELKVQAKQLPWQTGDNFIAHLYVFKKV